jgi:hypothetical protein
VKKKRNNNGIDKRFILTTHDFSFVFGYHMIKPTLTDDLEKVVNILYDKPLPQYTIKEKMRQDKISFFEDEHFSVKFHQNGNTHYVLSDDLLQKLNLLGTDGSKLGEYIKIKTL